MAVKFILGEDRSVGFEVFSTLPMATFIIENATFELLFDGEVESASKCTIEGHKLYCRLAPKRRSTLYSLGITYYVCGERFKKQIDIEVV